MVTTARKMNSSRKTKRDKTRNGSCGGLPGEAGLPDELLALERMMLDAITPAQRQLAEYMSELLTLCYQAGWRDCIECAPWHAVRSGPFHYGRLP
jgi:hypothetical protein